MKKIIAVLMLCFVALGAFAGSIDLEVSGAIPYSYSKSTNSTTLGSSTYDAVTTVTTTSYGINGAATLWLSNTAGLKAGCTFAKPSKSETSFSTYVNNKQQGDTRKTTTTISEQNGITYDKKVIFVGVSTILSSSNTSQVLFVPGVIVDTETVTATSSGSSITTTYTGFGADFAFHADLSKTAYLTVSIPVGYELTQKVNDKTNDNFKGRWITNPKVGIGIRF